MKVIIIFTTAIILICAFAWAVYAEHITPHFDRQEFNQPREPLPLSEVLVDHKLTQRLEDLRMEIGKPIKITSGYRTSDYNKKVGGIIVSAESQHLFGKAADIKVSNLSPAKLGQIARKHFSFVKIYSTFVHVDVR